MQGLTICHGSKHERSLIIWRKGCEMCNSSWCMLRITILQILFTLDYTNGIGRVYMSSKEGASSVCGRIFSNCETSV